MNLVHGFQDTFNILALRWRMIRKPQTRTLIILAAIMLGVLLYALTSSGRAIRSIASASVPEVGNQIQSLAVAYVSTFVEGSNSFAVTAVIFALVGSVVIIPLVGYSFSSLMPAGDLVSVRKTDYHKLSDSIVLQFLSSISLIQLIALTGLNSILSIESSAPGISIVFGWCLWFIINFITALVAWTFEYLNRKFGIKSKIITWTFIAITVTVLAIANPNGIQNAFGLSDIYASFVKDLDSLSFLQYLSIATILLTVLIGVSLGVSYVGSLALHLPERPKSTKGRNRVRISLGRNKSSVKQWIFLLNIVFRNSNIWKPLMLAVGFALISVVVLAGNTQVLSSLVFVIPLVVSLSWGVNAFGIIGGGVVWLTSMPDGQGKTLLNILKVQFILIAAIFILMLVPTALLGANFETIASFTLATLAASVIMSRSSLSKAVYGPERYRVHIKGEQVLPPAKALNYLAKLIFGGGIVGIIVFWTPGLTLKLLITGAVILWQIVRFVQLNHKWRTQPALLENVIKSVGY